MRLEKPVQEQPFGAWGVKKKPRIDEPDYVHAGGGWGDPLSREAATVAADVRNGAFSAETAKSIFGVVLDASGALEVAATGAARNAMRSARMAWSADRVLDSQPDLSRSEQVATVGDVARIVRNAGETFFVCNSCDTAVAPAAQNWKHYARHAVATAQDLGTRVRIHEDLEVVRHACPSCATLLDVEVKRKGEAPLFDIEVAA